MRPVAKAKIGGSIPVQVPRRGFSGADVDIDLSKGGSMQERMR